MTNIWIFEFSGGMTDIKNYNNKMTKSEDFLIQCIIFQSMFARYINLLIHACCEPMFRWQKLFFLHNSSCVFTFNLFISTGFLWMNCYKDNFGKLPCNATAFDLVKLTNISVYHHESIRYFKEKIIFKRRELLTPWLPAISRTILSCAGLSHC